MTNTVVGTPLYFSPEQFRNEHCTRASDVFSLGLVFFNILCGAHLFTTDLTDQTKFFKHLQRDGDLSDMMDYVEYVEMRDLLLNMLLDDPLKRFNMSQVC